MRSKHHTSGRTWSVRLNSDNPLPSFVAPIQASALDLPGEQRFGLVYLRRAGPDSLASKIVAHLNETGIPFPTGRHWFELRSQGYVTLGLTGHALTPKGNGAASAIMRDLARKFAIHHITRTGGYGKQSGIFVSCSCECFTAGPFASDNAGESRITRAIDGHMRDVAAGHPRGRSMIDFLNEYDPLSFDFTSGTVASGPENGAIGKEVSAYRHPVAPMDLRNVSTKMENLRD